MNVSASLDDKRINYRVDQLLLEQGQYSPLELLLLEGRLLYSDYEIWRGGQVECLADMLFGDPEQIRRMLQRAQTYVQQLGLQAETLNYSSWQGGTGTVGRLCFSTDSDLNRCFHTGYGRPPNQTQLDLFMDAPANSLVNGIIAALIDRNAAEARRQLECLYAIEPGHARIGELEPLVEAVESLDSTVTDIAAELQRLQNQLSKLAETLLGHHSRNLLIPHWRRLGAALKNKVFDPAQPDLHLSYVAGQALEWQTVRRAVENENGWQSCLVLLQRHALACEQLRQTVKALPSWFRICWLFPDQAGAIDTSTDPELQQLWDRFLELEPELEPPLFPAWLLLPKPGLAKWLPIVATGDNASFYQKTYRITQRIQSGKHNSSPSAKEIQRRAELKQLAPALFEHYLNAVATRS